MKKVSVIFLCLILLCLVGTAAACTGKGALSTGKTPIQHEEKFGGVYIEITIDDFNTLGFAFGDSVKIEFSSGFTLEDIPYYNGFYVDMGEPLLVGYPGYPYIRAGYNNGEDMYEKANLSPNDTAVITLVKKGKYLEEQNALDIHYSDEQGDRSDVVFANFRAVNVGNLKQNILYRSASPVDNQHKRATAADRLAAQAGIGFIINLSDNAEELASHIGAEDFQSPYALSLYNQGKIIPLSMSMAYKSETFSQKLVQGLTAASHADGPYLVHCVEGKDRTGFVCMVLEALAGATYREIVDDYMITYDNYYSINQTSEPSKYNIIKEKYIDVMLKYVTGDGNVDITTADYNRYAREYLLSIGMSVADIDALQNRLVNA